MRVEICCTCTFVRVSVGGVGWPWSCVRVAGWLVGWSVLVCAFVCAFVSASVCSLRGLFACVLSWVEIGKLRKSAE